MSVCSQAASPETAASHAVSAFRDAASLVALAARVCAIER